MASLFSMAGLVYTVIIFNGLVRLNNNIEKAYANIDVLLKQRFDEVPNLINVCKGYIKYERKVLTDLAKLRSTFIHTKSTIDKDSINQVLNTKIPTLYATVEKYPKLKSSKMFLHVQKRLTDLEMEIADRREFFNESVNKYNIRLESFPDMIIAKICHYNRKNMFEDLSDEEFRN
ncbi:MAG TPA: LemA family protein [Candidatus Nitrosocosmicus sp.]|nr:LemA family protein [Candidatus Nitrosocosmicus sp.]